MYETNVLGLSGPRKMTLLLPGVTSEGQICTLPYRQGACQLKEKFMSDVIADILVLRNKSPQWNEGVIS
jgi:tubby-related protein 1